MARSEDRTLQKTVARHLGLIVRSKLTSRSYWQLWQSAEIDRGQPQAAVKLLRPIRSDIMIINRDESLAGLEIPATVKTILKKLNPVNHVG
jgi:hypothetical protein